VADSVAAGADAVTFSGDKLLGGPQAGLIVGRRDAVERMNANPLKRALRCDKLTLAALDATLRLYRTSTDLARELPTLRYLTRDPAAIAATAEAAAAAIAAHLGPPFAITVEPCESQIGSGAQPTATLPSRAVVVSHPRLSPLAVAAYFRSATPPIVGRVHADRFWLDARCIDDPSDLVPLAAHSSILAPASR
jgi:L-seryl-tRNA(Ser) seleniumtransferase